MEALTEDLVIRQSNTLCKEFVFTKLRRFGLLSSRVFIAGILTALRYPNKRLGLTVAVKGQPSGGSAAPSTGLPAPANSPDTPSADLGDSLEDSLGGGGGVRLQEVSDYLCGVLGTDLEKRYPHLYREHACRRMHVVFTEPLLLHDTFTTVATHMFLRATSGAVRGRLSATSADIAGTPHVTWGKIVALYSVCGALAVDCIHQGHEEYLGTLVDALVDFLYQNQIVAWIVDRGGWGDLLHYGQCGRGGAGRQSSTGSRQREPRPSMNAGSCANTLSVMSTYFRHLAERACRVTAAEVVGGVCGEGTPRGSRVGLWLASLLVILVCFYITSSLIILY